MAEEIGRMSMSKRDQEQERPGTMSKRDQELLSFIKHKVSTDFLKEHSYRPEKVATRNDTKYVLIQDRPANWSYERRQDLLSRGSFSPVNKPYKPVGVLYFDNDYLFSTGPTSEDQESLKTHWNKKYGKKSSKSTNERTKKTHPTSPPIRPGERPLLTPQEESAQPPGRPADHHQADPHPADTHLADPRPADPRPAKGFLQLKQCLQEMASVRQAVLTGRPLIFCLRDPDQDERSALPKKEKLPRPPYDRVMSADKETVKPAAVSMQQQALETAEDESLQKQDRLSEKLQCIYMMLCGISHMRNRDLKTLVPLNSSYVNIIMKDTEQTSILKRSRSYFNPPVSVTRRRVSLVPEDGHSVTPDPWDAFVSQQDATEPKSSTVKGTGYRRRREGEGDKGDTPPWLLLLLDENTSLEKTQKPRTDQACELDRTEAEFLKRTMNMQMESWVFEKQKGREERMRALFNAFMVTRRDAGLSSLLSPLKSDRNELKSTTGFWLALLENEATELAGDKVFKYNSILEKISEFHNFSNKKVPYAKEKFCLLVISQQANQLLRPAIQEALLFLTENVLLLLPRQLKQWYQYLKLPFSVATPS